jgi:hypothetical protein
MRRTSWLQESVVEQIHLMEADRIDRKEGVGDKKHLLKAHPKDLLFIQPGTTS